MSIIHKIISTFKDNSSLEDEYAIVFQRSIDECKDRQNNFLSCDLSRITTFNEAVQKWDDSKKIEFILYMCSIAKKNEDFYYKYNADREANFTISIEFIKLLLNQKLKLNENDLALIGNAFLSNHLKFGGLAAWPFTIYLKKIKSHLTELSVQSPLAHILSELSNLPVKPNTLFYKEGLKIQNRIRELVFSLTNQKNVIPIYFNGNDEFVLYANSLLNNQVENDKDSWFLLMAQAQKATGSKPTSKYLNESKTLIDQLGREKFLDITNNWFSFICDLKEKTIHYRHTYNGQEYVNQTVEFVDEINSTVLKGFVWMHCLFDNNETIRLIGRLAEKCFKKIPLKGPALLAVGNACLYKLFVSEGLDGLAQLSMLKLKIKQNASLILIDKYINEAALKRGVSNHEIEDLAVIDFNLIDNKKSFELGEFKAEIEIIGIGKSILKWYKSNGIEQKSTPTIIKEGYAKDLKNIKSIQKQIDQNTSAQKERIDRLMRSNRVMDLQYFKNNYISHSTLSFVIQKLIFKFSTEVEEILGIYITGKWIDFDYQNIDIDKYSSVSLWHPATSGSDVVKRWRQFLMESEIQQPFKQAFREIYLITDAELQTRTYSNRMASHILKQHQYVSLAKGRNWKAKLIGAWDGGDYDTAELSLPDFNLKVEYWVNALNDEAQFNDTGIWNYITTDQVRFVNSVTNEVLEIADIPTIAFSEAMRDIDLFVGVASVGNDPTWRDSGGLVMYRDYWQNYSFGDLSELAKNRKEILTKLIPKLKVANVAHINGNFLVVKGQLRTYKIHIGSTNILMEPNDQYLCIVPNRNTKDNTGNLFLPFEGDSALSVIISKALLLANDSKITDTSITSQINR